MTTKMSMSDAGKLGYIKSQATRDTLHQKRIEDYYRNPMRCLYCDSVIQYEKLVKRKKSQRKFCRQSCAAKFNNNLRQQASLPRCCKHCNKRLYNTSKYCSSECRKEYYWNEKKRKFENNEWVSKVFLRSVLLKKYGNRCTMPDCGWDWEKPCVVEIDHIDGNPENNSPSNLRLICPNCHSQTSTYKGKNVGHGRYKRRERYRQGKSY